MSALPALIAPEKITAAHIRAGLKKTFPHPNFGIVFEVACATGFSANRHLDALVMDTWPSHGLTLMGVEIKVSRSDWKRELADPSKAEELARFCDKFYIAAPPDMIDANTLPDAWGLLEGGAGGVREKKRAVKTKAQPVTKDFLAAIMRAAGRGIAADESELALQELKDKLAGEHDERVKREAERLSTGNSDDAKNWRDLMVALGARDPEDTRRFVGHYADPKWIATVRAVEAAGIMEQWNGLAALRESVAKFYERLESAAAILNCPTPDGLAISIGRITRKKKP